VRLVVEHDITGEWVETGPPVADEGDALRSGSLSTESEEGRQVYVFGWQDGDGPAVWRSLRGADIEAVDENRWPRRVLLTTGLEVVHRLVPGDSTTLTLCQKGHIFHARLRLEP
jgi:hypothetical protein